jgi:hypothetical protein
MHALALALAPASDTATDTAADTAAPVSNDPFDQAFAAMDDIEAGTSGLEENIKAVGPARYATSWRSKAMRGARAKCIS